MLSVYVKTLIVLLDVSCDPISKTATKLPAKIVAATAQQTPGILKLPWRKISLSPGLAVARIIRKKGNRMIPELTNSQNSHNHL